jgi:integrase
VGRKSISGGVAPKGADRIELTFFFEGVRYRPTIKRVPSEANLRRARIQLEEIKRRIASGTFVFAEEFPEYRYMEQLGGDARGAHTCNDIFDEFMTHCESRMSKNDLAFATYESYRKILDCIWRPAIGATLFDRVKYSDLVKIADARKLSKKTYNNIISPLRCAFEHGYRDHPEKFNPASGLKGFRITKKDRPAVDPFSIEEAEALIAALHRDWGEAQGNYDEFRFFTGLRPSEQIALLVSDCDVGQGKISVTKARVMARDKDRTKTSEDRLVELCPRALDVLKRHLALRARLVLAGQIRHEHLFFKEDGSAIGNLQYPWVRWRRTLRALKARYRDPYNARHSSVSWNLMVGKNPLWVAKQHGHSVQTMLEVYAAWTEGANESDIEAIKRAMASRPRETALPSVAAQATAESAANTNTDPLGAPGFATNTPPEHPRPGVTCGTKRKNTGGREGFEPRRRSLITYRFLAAAIFDTAKNTRTQLLNPDRTPALIRTRSNPPALLGGPALLLRGRRNPRPAGAARLFRLGENRGEQRTQANPAPIHACACGRVQRRRAAGEFADPASPLIASDSFRPIPVPPAAFQIGSALSSRRARP